MFVGSTWPTAWLIVTVGPATSQVTVLSVEVEAVLALPTRSVALLAAIVATTVPDVVMPVTLTVNVVGPPLTVPVFAPPEVPPTVTSPVMKPVTGSLNTTVKRMGVLFVGSAWPTAWSIVTVGGVTSRVTVLSVEVDGSLGLPAASATTPAPIVAMTVPEPVIPLTVTVYVVGPPVTVAVVAPAVPDRVTSPPTKPMTVSLKTTVNLMVAPLVGSTWVAAWSMVTVGTTLSSAFARVNSALCPEAQASPL